MATSSCAPKLRRKYFPLNYPSDTLTQSGVTGIRSVKRHGHTVVYVTGFYRTEENNNSQSFIFEGNKRGQGIFHDLNFPSRPGLTVTATELYSLDFVTDTIIHAVGSFSAEELPGVQSCLYTGTLSGKGEWIVLLPNLTGRPVLSSIAHSVMGDVVVGNYTDGLFGSAYIYDIRTKQFFPTVTSQFPIISITNYGVWADSREKYTICGGVATDSSAPDITVAFVVDWNNKTRLLTNWRFFFAPDKSSPIFHFEGISGVCNGYILAAQSTEHAYFGRLEGKTPIWEVLEYPGAETTTSDSVAGQNIAIGSLTSENVSGLRGYISYLSRH